MDRKTVRVRVRWGRRERKGKRVNEIGMEGRDGGRDGGREGRREGRIEGERERERESEGEREREGG